MANKTFALSEAAFVIGTAAVVVMVCAFFCDQKQVLQLALWREKESRDVAFSKL
jgi:hypothetical protein